VRITLRAFSSSSFYSSEAYATAKDSITSARTKFRAKKAPRITTSIKKIGDTTGYPASE
jgi:hypothetical protein